MTAFIYWAAFFQRERGGYGDRLAAQGFDDFGGGNDLADVALGVVGYVNERAADGGGKQFAADAAKGVEVGCGENADAVRCVAEGDFNFG